MSHAYQAPQQDVATSRAGMHRLGIVLDIVGGILVFLALAMIALQAVAVTWASTPDAVAGNPSLVDWILSAADNTLATPGIILLFALCALIPGELLRRGGIGAASGPARQTLLPQGSFVAVFRPIGLGVHAVWLVLLVVVSFGVVIFTTASGSSSTWPSSVEYDGSYTVVSSFLAYGLLFAGIAGATLGSFVKKAVYARVVRTRGPEALKGSRGQAFWAWFTMRWRFDLWLCGAGTLLVAGSALPFSSDDAASGIVAIVAGLVILATGLWAAGNYWRAGAPLGVGESFS